MQAPQCADGIQTMRRPFRSGNRASVRLRGWHGACVTVVRRRCRMLPSPLPPSAALTVAGLLGPLSALLLVSVLAGVAAVAGWLRGECLHRSARTVGVG